MKRAIAYSAALLVASALAGLAGGILARPGGMTVPAPRVLPTIEELIVRESLDAGVPPDLTLDLAWEESRLDPRAIRHESNGTWSTGIFQINHPRPVLSVDVARQVHDGVAIAAFWWAKTHDRSRTIRAYRRGRL